MLLSDGVEETPAEEQPVCPSPPEVPAAVTPGPAPPGPAAGPRALKCLALTGGRSTAPTEEVLRAGAGAGPGRPGRVVVRGSGAELGGKGHPDQSQRKRRPLQLPRVLLWGSSASAEAEEC